MCAEVVSPINAAWKMVSASAALFKPSNPHGSPVFPVIAFIISSTLRTLPVVKMGTRKVGVVPAIGPDSKRACAAILSIFSETAGGTSRIGMPLASFASLMR